MHPCKVYNNFATAEQASFVGYQGVGTAAIQQPLRAQGGQTLPDMRGKGEAYELNAEDRRLLLHTHQG